MEAAGREVMADYPVEFIDMLKPVLANEGGLNMEEVGQGGVSNYGVTQQSYDSFLKAQKMSPMDVRKMTWDDAKDFYYKEYYQRLGIDKLPPKVGGLYFDYSVNSGPSRAAKDLQGIVGTKVDGAIGKNTCKKLNEYIADNGEDALADEYLKKRREFLNGLVVDDPLKYGEFERGWNNRIDKLYKQFDVQTEPAP